jgi:hypothetical protein
MEKSPELSYYSTTEDTTRQLTPPPNYAPPRQPIVVEKSENEPRAGPASPFPNPIIPSTHAEALKPYPEHLPYRLSTTPLWTRLSRNNKCRIAVAVLCFLIILGGTVAGAIFFALFLQKGTFYPTSGGGVGDATRTVQVTVTSVIGRLDKEMGPVMETVMQETRVVTQWIVVQPKTTTVLANATRTLSER